MVIAEEDRRRKALEERRVAQKEATKRFRSALSRIRSSTKGQGKNTNQNNESAIDCELLYSLVMVPNHCVDMHYCMHWSTPVPVL